MKPLKVTKTRDIAHDNVALDMFRRGRGDAPYEKLPYCQREEHSDQGCRNGGKEKEANEASMVTVFFSGVWVPLLFLSYTNT